MRETNHPKPAAPPPSVVSPLDAVAWQDALLQSYRNFQLVLQSIFTAAGVGLTIAVIALSGPIAKRLAAVLLVALACIALFIMFKLRRVISARGEDVWYWQRELVKAECASSGERYFCKFKVQQILRGSAKANVRDLMSSHNLSDSEIQQLISTSDPKMRRLLERTMVWSLTALWLVFLVIAAVALVV